MKIILEQKDLDLAVRSHITSLGVDLTGKAVGVDFTAGRGANGNTATVEITEDCDAEEPTSDPVVDETSTEPDDTAKVF